MPPRSATATRGRASSATAHRPVAGSAARARGPRASAAGRRRALIARRRRRFVAALLAAGAVVLVVLGSGVFRTAVKSFTLPLRHEDIIRQQAADKHLDPALIAAVIYAESHFRDGQTSAAGAEGLMQLTPDTARYIARKSGGSAFRVADLATPQVNIAYGSYYLRYLLSRYSGSEALALAAYNGGEGNVDHWRAAAAARGQRLTTAAIPFSETRAYVDRVESAKRSYRSHYRRELGL